MTYFNNHISGEGIVISSRIRLARNIKDVPFPHLLDSNGSFDVINKVSNAFFSKGIEDFSQIYLKDLDDLNRLSLFERHVISKDILENYKGAGLILNKDQDVSIMINEEDHIRLQVIKGGLSINEAYKLASSYDDIIEEKIDYAFDEKLGYLTSCPTNVGTGMRASVMMHLPALTKTGGINNVINTVTQVGMIIRGLYGEGSEAKGSLYQVSNQVTLGLSEEEIINNLMAVVNKIIDQENKTRKMLLERKGIELEDNLLRALGILKYARLMNESDSLKLLSNVRMGIEMGIIKDVEINKVNELLSRVYPATLQLIKGKHMDLKEIDNERAKMIRETLS